MRCTESRKGGGVYSYNAWPYTHDHIGRPSHAYSAGTEHVGFSYTLGSDLQCKHSYDTGAAQFFLPVLLGAHAAARRPITPTTKASIATIAVFNTRAGYVLRAYLVLY